MSNVTDGVSSNQLVAPWVNGSESLYVSRVRVAPGCSTTAKAYSQVEAVHFTLSGTGIEIVDGTSVQTHVGEFVFIPPGALHQVTNVGSDDLEILAIATPPPPLSSAPQAKEEQ